MRVVLATLMSIAGTVTAMADTGPLIVIPGRPGVPVILNGRDVSYAIVEGEWGRALYFRNPPRVFGGRDHYEDREVGHYYPTAGRMPGYGRLEIEPPANRALPRPAESYHQSWSAQSAPPAPQQQYAVPDYPPQVIEAQPNRSYRPNRLRPEPRPNSYRPNGFRPDLR